MTFRDSELELARMAFRLLRQHPKGLDRNSLRRELPGAGNRKFFERVMLALSYKSASNGKERFVVGYDPTTKRYRAVQRDRVVAEQIIMHAITEEYPGEVIDAMRHAYAELFRVAPTRQTDIFSSPSHSHTKTQRQQILEYLQAGNRLTPLEALSRFGCLRLGARAYDLRQQGHKIESHLVETANGKRVSEYYLAESAVERVA